MPALVAAAALLVGAAVSGSLVALGFGLGLLLAGALAVRLVGRRYRSWGYAEREDDLLVRRGVLFLPDRPRMVSRPPRRVFWKSPLRYRKLSWGRTTTCVATTSGRLRRVTSWVPLEKVQSLRRVHGPVQRRLRLASVHVDTAGRSVHATLRDRDAAEASSALVELTGLARAARKRPLDFRGPLCEI